MSDQLSAPGVYALISRAEKTVYVGQTISDVSRRLNVHLRNLAKGRHTNRGLQYLYDRIGVDAIEAVVLETVDREREDLSAYLLRRERHWFEEWSRQGYTNLSRPEVLQPRARRPHAVIGPPPGPGGVDMSQLTSNADDLERVLRAKYNGDLDKIAAEAQDFALAAIAVAKRVEAERQRQRADAEPDHK